MWNTINYRNLCLLESSSEQTSKYRDIHDPPLKVWWRGRSQCFQSLILDHERQMTMTFSSTGLSPSFLFWGHFKSYFKDHFNEKDNFSLKIWKKKLLTWVSGLKIKAKAVGLYIFWQPLVERKQRLWDSVTVPRPF